ncbi:Hypothetical predicted protein [Mytilus galloprovincialis]|uniref:Uncharacterized protein n=1 Tax=Mytilus galloprovincialis TaxID=29158 RepID=A0A8B6G669_MYTGA|nr:Hypothetical predicted protein [Mytilus galloprovincialis]
MDMSAKFKDDEPNQQAVVRFCRGIIRVAQFELALKNYEQLEEAIQVAEAREAELAKELGRYRYGDKFDEKEMSIFSREFSPAKQSVAEFKFTLNEFECIAREIKESEEKDKREILEEELKTETERHSTDTTETYSEIARTNSDEIDTEAAEIIDLRASVDQDSTCTITPGSVIPKRSGKIIAVNPFITRNFINFKYRETIQPSISQKQNEQIEKGETLKTKKETKLEKKRVKEEEMVFKKYLKIANRRMKKYKKESKRQLEKEEKENKKKLKKEQKERARIEKNEMKDRKKLEKEMKNKEGSKVKNDSHVINMPIVLEHMDIALKKNDEDFKDDGKGNLNNDEKKNTVGKSLQYFFRSLICAKK